MPHIEPLQAADRPQARDEPELTLVPRAAPGERARRLQMEARLASLDHLAALKAAIGEAHDLSQAVIDGGDLYDVGVRDLASRLVEELAWRGKSLEAFMFRQRPLQRARATP